MYQKFTRRASETVCVKLSFILNWTACTLIVLSTEWAVFQGFRESESTCPVLLKDARY